MPEAIRPGRPRLIVSILLIGFIFTLLGREIAKSWNQIPSSTLVNLWPQLSLYLAFMLVFHIMLASAWHGILKSHGVGCTFGQSAFTFFAANLGKYLPGKVLYVLGRLEFTRQLGVDRLIGLSCFTLEQLQLTLIATLFSLPAITLALGIPKTYTPIVVVTSGILTLLVLMNLHHIMKLANRVLLRYSNRPDIPALPGLVRLRLLGNYCLAWLIYSASGCLLIESVFGLSPEDFVFVGSAFTAAWLIGFLSVLTPGGIGVREGVLVALLLPILGAGEASLIAISTRIIWSIAELVLAALSFFLKRAA
jgi:glycosyltransferase 2 family protein